MAQPQSEQSAPQSFILSISFQPPLAGEVSAEQKAKIQSIVGGLVKGVADYIGGEVFCLSPNPPSDTLPDDVAAALKSLFPANQVLVRAKDDFTALTFEEVGNVASAPLSAVAEVHKTLVSLVDQPNIQPESVFDVLFRRPPPEVDQSWPKKPVKGIDMGTGDVLLFAGTHSKSVMIRQVQWSKYSHAALVLQEDDGRLFILQSNGDNGVTYDDLATYATKYDGAVVHRKLVVADAHRPAIVKSLRTFKAYALGAPYTGKFDFVKMYFETVLRGKGVAPKEKAFFCSQLVAQAYMEAGLFEERPLASVYIPERFSHDTKLALPFLLGASLSAPPTIIDQKPAAQ